MNKYEKMIRELKEGFDREFSNYSNELDQLNDSVQAMCHKYNDQVHAINSLRQNLQDEITALYRFLRRFGDLGKQVTPFDYVTENSRYTKDKASRGSLGCDNSKGSSGFAKAATISSIIFAPVALPVVWAADSISKRSKNKKEFQELEMDFQKQCTEWEQTKRERRAEAKLYEEASEIAKLYRALIATVRMAIRETILPELTGIDAFLIADAIKNAIISNMNPDDAEVANISVYQGSAYDMHYVFVRNALDYYTMIVKFFTEPILTNIIADNKVTPEEKTDFHAKVAQIEKQTKLLEDTSMFGGDI